LAEGEEAKELGFTRSHHEDLLSRDYFFSLRCLGDNIPIRSRLLKRLMERLANELVHHTNAARFDRYRTALQERLEYLRGSEATSVLVLLLVTALHDKNAGVRSYAARSLAQLGQASAEGISALLTALHDENARVRSDAAWSLAQPGQASPEVISALLIVLHDQEAGVRSDAARSLARLGQASPEVISALLTALHDQEATVRSGAARSLAQLGQASPEVISALLTALHDEEAGVRSSAARSLGQLGQASPEVSAGLREALHEATPWSIRRDSARFLGQIGQGDEATLNALWSGLLDSDNDVREACAQALARLGRQISTITQDLEAKFVEAIQDPKFEKPDNAGRPAYDYAYDGLWFLVIGGEIEEK